MFNNIKQQIKLNKNKLWPMGTVVRVVWTGGLVHTVLVRCDVSATFRFVHVVKTSKKTNVTESGE